MPLPSEFKDCNEQIKGIYLLTVALAMLGVTSVVEAQQQPAPPAPPALPQAGAVMEFISSFARGPDGGCSQADLRSTGGDRLFYCFAA
jgi:hypothetical protein